MKVLIVGGGGREHALAWKIRQSPRVAEIYCAPGNGGIAKIAQCVPYKSTDIENIVAFARDEGIDLTVVAQDDPLALGMVDALEAAGLRAFGPDRAAARIESSKSFAKDLMRKYGIPTADYRVFEDAGAARAYLEGCAYPIVIKADGLALGKGVIVAQEKAEALDAVGRMMEQGAFGAAGARVVIEEFMTGPEVSVLAFTDGAALVPMVSAQDHKRAFDGDRGPNTGGMGAICPSPHYTADIAEQVRERIMLPTVRAMAAEGCPFSGVLYFGLMLTPQGPRVVEYNARFGDPEAQAVLMRLETDIIDIFDAIIDKRLSDIEITWSARAAACIVMASGGYPGAYETGKPIYGLDALESAADTMVFHAGTKPAPEGIVTSGGRVLGVSALGDTLGEAIARAYAAADAITFDGAFLRRDIGGR